MDWWMWLLIIFGILAMISNGKGQEEQRKAAAAELRRRKEAEDYIMQSGDQEAIKQLMLARANPANYNQTLAAGAGGKGNETLKTAAGVMAGVAAGNLISTAITAHAVSEALEDVQASIDDIDLA